MTAPTIERDTEQPVVTGSRNHSDLRSSLLTRKQQTRIYLPCSVDSDWETPCPMTGRNECPSDQKTIDKCPQC